MTIDYRSDAIRIFDRSQTAVFFRVQFFIVFQTAASDNNPYILQSLWVVMPLNCYQRVREKEKTGRARYVFLCAQFVVN